MEKRDYILRIKDICNPTKDEIIEFAYSREEIPIQDWQLFIIHPMENIKAIITVVNDKNCPKIKFFLSCLYLFVGDYIRGGYEYEIDKIDGFKNILAFAKQFDSEEIKDWINRTEELVNNPDKYDYKYWGMHSRYVYNSTYISNISNYICCYTGEEFIHISYNEKMGLMNKQGKIILEMEYEGIYEFVEDMAIINQDNKYGFIDNKGIIVIPPTFDYVRDFKEDISITKTGKDVAFINKSGQVLGRTEFYCVEDFNEGFAIIKKDEKYGFIDENGNVAIESNFQEVSVFENGYAVVRIENNNANDLSVCGYINKNGNYIITPIFHEAYCFEKGIASFIIYDKDENEYLIPKWGIVDEKGNYIVESQFDFIGVFIDDVAEVEKDKKWGYLNRDGKLITEIIFDETRPFCEDLAKIKIVDKWGFINKSGQIVIEPRFQIALDF